MKEVLPNGTNQEYSGYCDKCKKQIVTNPQGYEIGGHELTNFEVLKERKTDKGFQVIDLSIDHILKIGGLGICDSCNQGVFKFIYIGALNHAYCEKCFEEWHERAIYYPQDGPYEENRIQRMLTVLNN